MKSIQIVAVFCIALSLTGCIPSSIPQLAVPTQKHETHIQAGVASNGFTGNVLFAPTSFLLLGAGYQHSIRNAGTWELDAGYFSPAYHSSVLLFYGKGSFDISPSIIFGGTNEYVQYYGNYRKMGLSFTTRGTWVGGGLRLSFFGGHDGGVCNTTCPPFKNRSFGDNLAVQPYIFFNLNRKGTLSTGLTGSIWSGDKTRLQEKPYFTPTYLQWFMTYDFVIKPGTLK